MASYTQYMVRYTRNKILIRKWTRKMERILIHLILGSNLLKVHVDSMAAWFMQKFELQSQPFYDMYLLIFDRDFMDLLLSPASKVLNNWFEVVILILISLQFYLLRYCFHLYQNSKVMFKFTSLSSFKSRHIEISLGKEFW